MSNEVVPVSQVTASRLMSDGSIETVDPVTQSLTGGILPLSAAETGAGFAGLGIKDANGVVRARITFADDGGIVLATLDSSGSFVTEIFMIGTAVAVHHGSFNPGALLDLSGLPTADPHVAGIAWSNAGAVKVSAG